MSAIIKARLTKFGMKVSLDYVQIKFISNAVCHAERPRKSIISFLKSICKTGIKDILTLTFAKLKYYVSSKL